MRKILISEQEKNHIKKLHNINEQSFIEKSLEMALKRMFEKPKSSSETTSSETKPSDSTSSDTGPIDGDVKLVGNFDDTQKRNIKLMIDYMNEKGITDPLAQIGILSVISKECNFKPKSEVSYATTSNSRIRKIFGKRVAKYSDSELNSIKQDEERFFNIVYANIIGNGNEASGDGYRYRGRGFNQLTGRGNYRKYGNMIGKDLVGNPDLVNDPETAAEIAIAFFTKGKSGGSFPRFTDKEDAAGYFADINAGGGSSSHRGNAIAASTKFDVNVA
jgi:predicted chitinase